VDLGFRGEVADFYHRFRRGYPAAVVDELVRAFGLGVEDVVVDLGCGTGQLALPLAARVRAVVGVDPEPDMLLRARKEATERRIGNASWMIGADTDLPAIADLLDRRAGAITIGQALHWMDADAVFRAGASAVRANGGVAVVTNGKPLWLQDTPWSQALRAFLETWLGKDASFPCGTDDISQRRYRDGMTAAGLHVHGTTVSYRDELTLETIVGGVYSALPVDRLPAPEQRTDFTERLRRALPPAETFSEHVQVHILVGVRRA
jgi:SAM-dependent methyltransferase